MSAAQPMPCVASNSAASAQRLAMSFAAAWWVALGRAVLAAKCCGPCVVGGVV
eukprot:CAMPEP_0179221422 /NCGR_PEP_ID=MMETSP0797-20121207/6183_1 /TAXON_ID=47934 /ORGANISM="Dinophysis acuminata, Strain DAEP01" /LENGTH=52 /DNA_ID=CAMNT_0020928205 /DNA_START=79 /DNA_END=237 /DNA_ORIENTATION=-